MTTTVASGFAVSSAFPVKHGLGLVILTPSGAVGQLRLDLGQTSTGPWFTLQEAGVPFVVTSGANAAGFVAPGGGPFARLNASVAQTFTGSYTIAPARTSER